MESNRAEDRYEMPLSTRLQLKKKQYGLVGKQASVKICLWTKKALKREYVCYKQRFYGAETHRCAEITPITAICSQNCIYCWRPMEWMKFYEPKEDEVDDPKEIIEGILKERRQLLSGFKGNEKVDQKLLEESYDPSHWAISLSGEPTLYPRLHELIKLLWNRKSTKTIFVVSNGEHPETFMKMYEYEKGMPSQIYISLDAPNEELFKKINRPVYKDGWERLIKTLTILSKMPVRKVARLTLIKGLNDSEEYMPEFAKIFELGNFDFIEIKAFMLLGYSRRRLSIDNMPTHKEIKEYAEKLLRYLPNYRYEDEVRMSRIVLLRNIFSPWPRYIREVPEHIKDIPSDKDDENMEMEDE